MHVTLYCIITIYAILAQLVVYAMSVRYIHVYSQKHMIQCMLVYALYTAGRDDTVEFLLSVGASIEVIVYMAIHKSTIIIQRKLPTILILL